MLYKELYKESNELAKERFVLVRERVAEIEEKPETEEKYKEYFRQTAQLLQKQTAVYDLWADDAIQKQSLKEAERCNQALYKDILGEAYQTSYANPDYAVEQLGEEFGQLLCAYLAYIRRETGAAFRGDLMQLTIQMELFVEIYNRFEAGEEKDVPEKSAVQQDLYWFFHDYSEIFYEKSLRRLIDPAEDFENDIVMNADLNDLRYLYRYGVYIGENEKKMAAFLNRLTDEEIQAMADTYTEGYRIPILSADFANLERDIRRVSSADWLHVDVMDGCFVPNLTIGVPVVQSIRKCTGMFLDVHLMIDKPVRYVEAFAQAGADLLSVHLEADHPTGIAEALRRMEACKVKRAVALRPITAPSAVLPYLEGLDMVLVMTVEPGFGGQAFLEHQLDTIRQVRALIERYNPSCRLEVDGGINAKTAAAVVAAGADTLVAGSAVYGAAEPAAAIAALRGD